MNTEPKILSEQYVRGRIWSFIRFKKYLEQIAHIFCEEFFYEKHKIIDVNMCESGKTVWIHFDSGTIGFDSAMLWDENVRETFRKHYNVDTI